MTSTSGNGSPGNQRTKWGTEHIRLDPNPKLRHIRFHAPMFNKLIYPLGFLSRHRACHALYYYAQIAQENWTKEKHYPVQVGKPDPVFNYHQLFRSVARIYGVQPEDMVPWWDSVDSQLKFDNEPILPNEEKYRFSKKPVIVIPKL